MKDIITLDLVYNGYAVTAEQRDIVIIAQSRSSFWNDFIIEDPLQQSGWYNELIGWLVDSYPDEFRVGPLVDTR